jgi:hypothetical protein
MAGEGVRRRTNLISLASFVCGLVPLIFELPLFRLVISRPDLLSVMTIRSVNVLVAVPFLAILFGVLGLAQARNRGERGRPYAVLGLLFGCVALLPLLLAVG